MLYGLCLIFRIAVTEMPEKRYRSAEFGYGEKGPLKGLFPGTSSWSQFPTFGYGGNFLVMRIVSKVICSVEIPEPKHTMRSIYLGVFDLLRPVTLPKSDKTIL